MKKFLITLGALLSSLFLITRRTDVFLGTTTSFHIFVGVSLILLGVFMYFYFGVFEKVLVQQLQSIQQKKARGWSNWFAETTPEWTSFIISLIPYLIGGLAITKGITAWLPSIAFIQTIAFICVMLICMFVVFLVTNCLYNKIATK